MDSTPNAGGSPVEPDESRLNIAPGVAGPSGSGLDTDAGGTESALPVTAAAGTAAGATDADGASDD